MFRLTEEVIHWDMSIKVKRIKRPPKGRTKCILYKQVVIIHRFPLTGGCCSRCEDLPSWGPSEQASIYHPCCLSYLGKEKQKICQYKLRDKMGEGMGEGKIEGQQERNRGRNLTSLNLFTKPCNHPSYKR